MAAKQDKTFQQQRDETFDRVIALIDARLKTLNPPLLTRFDEMSPDALLISAERDVWTLFFQGVKYLKDGAPNSQPGSMSGALSRTSLRSSTFSRTLGIKVPQFEQLYFTVDQTNGYDMALFFCRRLIEAAEGDFSKSKQLIQQKMKQETPAGAFGIMTDTDPNLKKIFDAVKSASKTTPSIFTTDTVPEGIDKSDLSNIKRQMVFSFNILTDTYMRGCQEFKDVLSHMKPPRAPAPGQDFEF